MTFKINKGSGLNSSDAASVSFAKSSPDSSRHKMISPAQAVLKWYDDFGRNLPWRVRGKHPDPYIVWISEIMLQQTTVQTVIPYFERFIACFPNIYTLAEAPLSDVLLLWQGLGYYSRARNLHKCARLVVENYGGNFPQEKKELLKLPGIGPYTAAAICALAFDKSETIVDGNVLRVISRLYAIRGNVTYLSDEIYEKAKFLTPQYRAADYTSGILDLGATVCTPESPLCQKCPLNPFCLSFKRNIQSSIPLIIRPEKEKKTGILFYVKDQEGRFLVRKRSEKGLLSGLTEYPWKLIPEDVFSKSDISKGIPPSSPVFLFDAPWKYTGISVRHTFTHIKLTLYIYECSLPYGLNQLKQSEFSDAFFITDDEMEIYPFSNLMKKAYSKLKSKEKNKSVQKDITNY